MVFREAPPHHVGHTKRFDSQQVEDHGVGESELRLEQHGFTLNQMEQKMSAVYCSSDSGFFWVFFAKDMFYNAELNKTKQK